MTKREKTFFAILDAGWTLFNEHGYHNTTTRQISERAGVATGTVFSHFPTKPDILKIAMDMKVAAVLDHAAETDTHHTPRLKLRHYAKYLYAFYLQHREFSKELVGHILWQKNYFSVQIEDLKKRLYAEQEYDETQANIMIDCYIMTKIHGLREEHTDAEMLVRMLSNKLQLIQK